MKKRYGPRLRMLHSCTDQAMTGALAEMGLTAAQGHIMGFLSRASTPPCPRDIEDFFQLSHPTVSGLLRRLEKKEFIALRPDPADKRCKRIYILPRGEACHQHMLETINATEERLVKDFSPEERLLFSQFLDRAIHNMGGVPRRPFPKQQKEE